MRTRVAPQLKTPRVEPIPAPFFYPGDMRLKFAQHCMLATGAASVSTVVSRPIYNAHHFHFVAYVPAVLTTEEKWVRFWHQLRVTKWFSYPVLLRDQFFGYALPIVINAWMHERVERFFGRAKRPRVMRFTERKMLTTDPGGYDCPIVHTGTWRYMLWIADGFISGAGTGFAYSILRHPIDVMRHAVTAPDSPKRFTGVADVLLTTLRHKPQNIFEIYKGFPVAAAASATRCSVFFGLYHTWKYDAGSCHIAVFFALAQVSAIVAELAHYPWLKLRALVVKANQRRRFSRLSVVDVVNELRRTGGASVVADGFWSSRPGFGSVGLAMSLVLYDYGLRYVHEQTRPRQPAK